MDYGAVNDQVCRMIVADEIKCPVCRNGDFEIGKIWDETKLRYTGPTPTPPDPENTEAVCSTCGNVLFFKIAHIMDRDLSHIELDEEDVTEG